MAEPIIDELNKQANEMNHHKQAGQQLSNTTNKKSTIAMEQDGTSAPPTGAAQNF